MHNEECFLTLLVYVDGVLITSTYEAAIVKVKEELYKQFTIKDIAYAYFLCLEISHSSDGTYINQHKYTLDILEVDACLLEGSQLLLLCLKGLHLALITMLC